MRAMSVTVCALLIVWPAANSPSSVGNPVVLQINASVEDRYLDSVQSLGRSFGKSVLKLLEFLEPVCRPQVSLRQVSMLFINKSLR